MRQLYLWSTNLRGVRTSLFLLGALAVSALISGLYSRPTAAESFLHKTTCTVVGILGIQCRTAPVDTQIAPGSGADKPVTAETAPAAEPVSPSKQPVPTPVPTTFAPIDMPKEQLPKMTPMISNKREPHDSVGYSISTGESYADDESAVLGITAQTPLQPSVEGWKVFGIAWYWWLSAVGIVASMGYLMKKRAWQQLAEHS